MKHPNIASAPLRTTLAAALLCVASTHAQSADGLTSLSLEQLLDISIVGASKYVQKQQEVAAAVSVITRQEIKAFGWRTLAQALATLPGLYTTYDRQYTYLGARGFGLPGDFNTRILVNINGNRINDATFDQGPVDRIFPLDMGLVERIEFIPGPGGAVYGQNAMFGVVNVITRTGADIDGAELAASYGPSPASREGRASWGKVLDNGTDVVLSVSGMSAPGKDRWFDFGAAGISGVAAGLDGERDREFFARLAHGAWSLEVTHGDRRKADPTGAYFSDPLVAGQYQADAYDVAQLQYQGALAGDSLQLNARLFMGQERYRSLLSYGTFFSFPATGSWQGAELRLLSTALERHKVMLGLELQRNSRLDQASLDLANPVNDIVIPGSGHRAGIYAQDEWQLTDLVTVTFGLRADNNNITGTKLSPRGALIWSATPQTTLKALYGRAHRAPNAYERNYDDGIAQVANPTLGGERVDTLELVADHRVGRDLTLRASAYMWTMRGLISLGIDPISGIPQYQSGEDVKARGLELSADKTWDAGARLRASVSLQHVTLAGGGAPPNSPRLLGKLNFSTPLPVAGARLGYELKYDSKRTTLNGTRLGGYGVSNLYLSTDALAKGLELSLALGNVFDKRFAQPGADNNWQDSIAQDGRNVSVSLLYRF